MDQDYSNSSYGRENILQDSKMRKERTIGLLAERILQELPYAPEKDEKGRDTESWEMTVDQIGRKLDIRVGSVYEVFHVFESLLLATKIGPKTYRWNGFSQLRRTLSFLQYIGMDCLNLPKEMEEVQDLKIDALLKQASNEPLQKIKIETPALTPSLWPGIGDLIGQENTASTSQPAPHTSYRKDDGESGKHESPSLEQDDKGMDCKRKLRQLKKEQEYLLNDKTKHILQVIQKFIMLFIVPSRINQKKNRALSLSYAAKVIHGVQTLPEEVLLIRTRRLYDISNILVSISRHCDKIAKKNPNLGFKSGEDLFSMRKVRLSNGSCVRRTTIQYQGPEVEPLQITDIMHLPDYRREYLFFSVGKAALGIPERPLYIPRTTTLRLSPVEGGEPQVIPSEGLQLNRLAILDMKKPISHEEMIYLESVRRNVTAASKENQESIKNEVAEIDPQDLWLAILPGQKLIKECFGHSNVQQEKLETLENVN